MISASFSLPQEWKDQIESSILPSMSSKLASTIGLSDLIQVSLVSLFPELLELELTQKSSKSSQEYLTLKQQILADLIQGKIDDKTAKNSWKELTVLKRKGTFKRVHSDQVSKVL